MGFAQTMEVFFWIIRLRFSARNAATSAATGGASGFGSSDEPELPPGWQKCHGLGKRRMGRDYKRLIDTHTHVHTQTHTQHT